MPTVSGSGAGGDLFHLTERERLQREQTDLTLRVLPTFGHHQGRLSRTATGPGTAENLFCALCANAEAAPTTRTGKSRRFTGRQI